MAYMVTEDRVPIYFIDEGPRSDAAILLIHGEPFNSAFWARNIGPLAGRFRTVAMDVRGRGASGKTENGHTIAQFAQDVGSLVEHLGLTQVVLVGWSLGSAIGWSYLEQFGQGALRGFVNVDQSPYRFVSNAHLETSHAVVRGHRLDNHLSLINRFLGPEAGVDADTRLWMACECMKTHSHSHSAIITEAYLSDFRPLLASISIPNQFYWSTFGAVKPEMATYLIDNTPGCESIFFEGCGHLIPWVQPDRFNTELGRFAARVLPRRDVEGGTIG